MSPEAFKDFISKIDHDLAGQRRCLDLVHILLSEGVANIDDAKMLLAETIEQFDLTQKGISRVQDKVLIETKPEKGIS